MGNRHNKQRILQKEQHIKVVVSTSSSGNRSRSLLPILCSKTSIKDVAAEPSIRLDHHQMMDDQGSEEEEDSTIITDQEPLSPKVGCMGQVKKKKKRSNRVSAGAPTHLSHHPHIPNINPRNNNKNKSATKSARSANNSNVVVVAVNYSKIRKLFSGKNLLLGSTTATDASPARAPIAAASSNTSTAMTGIRSKSWVGPRSMKKTCDPIKGVDSSQELNFIREMDPPLPVVTKKVEKKKPEEEDGKDDHGHGGGSSLLWKRRFGDVSALKTLDLNHQLKTIHHRPLPQPLTV